MSVARRTPSRIGTMTFSWMSTSKRGAGRFAAASASRLARRAATSAGFLSTWAAPRAAVPASSRTRKLLNERIIPGEKVRGINQEGTVRVTRDRRREEEQGKVKGTSDREESGSFLSLVLLPPHILIPPPVPCPSHCPLIADIAGRSPPHYSTRLRQFGRNRRSTPHPRRRGEPIPSAT